MEKKKSTFILLIGFMLITGFLITSLNSFFVSRSALRAEIAAHALPLTSDDIYAAIQRDLKLPVFISGLMAADTFFRDWVLDGERDADKIRKYLLAIQTRYNTITSFFVSNRTGIYTMRVAP